MSKQHTEQLDLRPDMTIAEMLTHFLNHFDATGTNTADFVIPGTVDGKPAGLDITVRFLKYDS